MYVMQNMLILIYKGVLKVNLGLSFFLKALVCVQKNNLLGSFSVYIFHKDGYQKNWSICMRLGK